MRYLVGVLARWGLQPWWDVNLVATSGVALNREVAAAIEQADVVLVLLSSQSAASMYCLGEVGYCLERSKRIVRIDVEPVATPAGLLPLSAARGVVWHGVTQGQAEADLARALTAEGIVLDLSGMAGSAGSASDQLFLDDPDNATIRPRYSQLLAAGPDRAREYALRLARAAAANPANGFNALSLALVWLYIGDGQRALACAQVATAAMPQSSDAHYAEALALCMTRALDARTRAEVEDILRRLAIARRLTGAGAHVDVLTATVIANHYLPRYVTPPASPDAVLTAAISSGRRIDMDECRRAWSVEPACVPGFMPDAGLLARFGLPPR